MSEENNNQNNELLKIEKEISQLKPDFFKGIPTEKKIEILRLLSISASKTHIGPLPDAETLGEYSKLIPDGANRIMKMAEEQSKHRMYLEKKVLRGQLLQSNIGQFLAFFIGITALSSATFLGYYGQPMLAGVIGIGGITGLVTAFIQGKSHQKKSLEEKNPRPVIRNKK